MTLNSIDNPCAIPVQRRRLMWVTINKIYCQCDYFMNKMVQMRIVIARDNTSDLKILSDCNYCKSTPDVVYVCFFALRECRIWIETDIGSGIICWFWCQLVDKFSKLLITGCVMIFILPENSNLFRELVVIPIIYCIVGPSKLKSKNNMV